MTPSTHVPPQWLPSRTIDARTVFSRPKSASGRTDAEGRVHISITSSAVRRGLATRAPSGFMPSISDLGNRFLRAMSTPDLERLRPAMTAVTHTLGEVLNEAGSNVDMLSFPDGSILSVITLMEDGRGVESCTLGRETGYGLLNALGAKSAFNRVICQVPGPAHRIPASAFKEAVAESPGLLSLVARHAQVQAGMSEQSAACNAIHNVEARLCRWLLVSSDRAASEVLPMTQEFLGFMLGVQRTTVTSAARGLQSAGAIRYSRGRLEILNRAALEDGACECYRVLQRRTDELIGAED